MSSLDEIISGNGAGKVILAETSAEGFNKSNCDLVRKVTEEGYRTVIITINNPSLILKRAYIECGLNVAEIYFIDAITRYALGSIPEDHDNTVFISQPGNLTDIGIELNRILGNFAGMKTCVIIDSANALLIYVPSSTLTKFIHFVSNKLRLLNCLGIYVSTKGSIDPILLNQLKSLSDELVEI